MASSQRLIFEEKVYKANSFLIFFRFKNPFYEKKMGKIT
jgi:hypothetical protein